MFSKRSLELSERASSGRIPENGFGLAYNFVSSVFVQVGVKMRHALPPQLACFGMCLVCHVFGMLCVWFAVLSNSERKGVYE